MIDSQYSWEPVKYWTIKITLQVKKEYIAILEKSILLEKNIKKNIF